MLEVMKRRAGDLARCASDLASLQGSDGGIVECHGSALRLLNQAGTILKDISRTEHQWHVANAFRDDVLDWHRSGLDSPPDFLRVRDAICPPRNRELIWFIGPTCATNSTSGASARFEAFVAKRDEPSVVRELSQKMPHPGTGCQSLRLLASSSGFSSGNCIVFFPENIASRSPVWNQTFAFFFLNKFEHIYRRRTLSAVDTVLSDGGLFGRTHPVSAEMDTTEIYEARCAWAYLHDYFHCMGARPFEENLALKCRFFTGALEELRVDALAVLYLWASNHQLALPITEMVLLERLLRYPKHPECVKNFDAASGVWLFEWLRKEEAITFGNSGTGVSLDLTKTLRALQLLVDTVDAIERLDDASYVARATALARGNLAETCGPARFRLPAAYARATQDVGPDLPLEFRDVLERELDATGCP